MKSIFDVEFNFVGQDNFKKYFQNLKSYVHRFINKCSKVYFFKNNKYKCNFKKCMPLFCRASSLLLSKVQKGFTGI